MAFSFLFPGANYTIVKEVARLGKYDLVVGFLYHERLLWLEDRKL
jgi:hypothetical protein